MERLVVRPDAVFRDQWPGWFQFLGIDRERFRKPLEWIPVAESLASNNGGRLPSNLWLIRNGYGALSQMIRKYPDLFKGFEQDKARKTLRDHVVDAETLASQNGGELQNRMWLRQNGYSPLCQIMAKHPERFSHIPQKRIVKTLDENVAKAERLAAGHDGCLPNSKWLTRNGHNDLVSAIQAHPKRFAHVPRIRIRFTLEENIAKAEAIARGNGGALPCLAELVKMKLHNIVNAKRKHPDRFKHIKQERRRSGTSRRLINDQGESS